MLSSLMYWTLVRSCSSSLFWEAICSRSWLITVTSRTNVTTRATWPCCVENGVAVQDQLLPLLGGLDGGGRLAGFDDLGVEDDIENALLDEILNPAADQVFALEADELLVHRIDLEGVAVTVGDVDAVAQDIQNAVEVGFYSSHQPIQI